MSNKHVDERVVRMQFDNEQFETRAKNTISTLGLLTEALQFKNGSSGFENIRNAAQKLDFSKLSEAVELVNYRFSALGIMATNVLNRISNAAITAGKNLVTSITTTPIKDGFNEYELKMESVKRILNSAKNENGMAVTLEQVNQKLDELNRYADKTIYSFSDMTTNIGKFTNAGVSLDKSVAAIQGIANEAALAGANSQEASRAMYNFAQALSAGYVKLIDWKSIENANMATVGFKEELIKTGLALGTLTKQGDKYISTTKDMNGHVSEAFNATTLFNESLGNQWMTSEVLTETLAKYADETTDIGKAAAKAATEVTTFHKMIDALKEAMGSGWAQTWEIIFGDFEESKRFWTSINGVLSEAINKSAESRNKLLEGWESLSGRDALLKGLGDIWGGIRNLANEAAWAFQRVLPEIDAFDLTRWSVGIRTAGENFRKFTGEIGPDFSRTMEGIAAAVDLVGQLFSAIGRTVSPIFGPLVNEFESLLGTTGDFGSWLSTISKSTRETDFFYNKIQAVIQAFKDFGAKVVEVKNKILEFFGISKKLTEDFKPTLVHEDGSEFTYIEKLAYILGKLRTKIMDLADSVRNSDGFKMVVDGVKQLASSAKEFVKNVGTSFFEALKSLTTGFGDATSNPFDEKSGMFSAYNVGLLGLMALAFKKLSDNLQTPFDAIKKFFGDAKSFKEIGENAAEGLREFFETLTGPLKEFQNSLRADVLIKIATAVAIIAGAAIALSAVDPEKLTKAVIAIGAIMGELTGVTTAMSKLIDANGARTFAALGTSLVAFAVAIGILSLAVSKLSGLDEDALLRGVLAVGVLMTLATLMTKLGGKNFGAKGLIAMSVAILILQISVRKLGEMDIDSLTNGIVAVGILIGLLALMSKYGGKNFSAAGMFAISIAITKLTAVVEQLGSLDVSQLRNGLIAVGVLMTLMTLVTKLGGKNVSSVALIAMAASVLILQKVISEFSELDPDDLLNGVLAVGVLLTLMTLVSQLGGKNVSSVALIAMAASVLILQKVITELSLLDPASVQNGIEAVGLLLGLMTIMSNLGKSNIGFAAGLLIIAAAIRVLVPAIAALGELPFVVILQAMATMALTFGILYVAGMALAPVIPVLLGLSAAMAIFGVGLLALGSGLMLCSVAMVAFGAAFVANIALVFDALIVLIKKLGETAGTIAITIAQLGAAVIDALLIIAPKIGEALITIALGIMKMLTDYAPTLTDSFIVMVITIIDGVAAAIYNNTDKFVAACAHILGAVIDFILAAVQEILSEIPGVGDKISAKMGEIRDKVKEKLGPEQGKQDGSEYAQGIVTGVSSAEPDARSSGRGIGESVEEGSMGILSNLSPDIKEALIGQFSSGITGATPDAESEATGMGSGVYDALLEGLGSPEDIGSFIDEGMTNGMLGNQDLVNQAGELLGTDLMNSLNEATGVSSPSTISWDTGMYIDQGLANGVTDNQSLIGTAIGSLGTLFNGALDGLKSVFSNKGSESGSAFSSGVASGAGSASQAASVISISATSALQSGVPTFHQNGTTSGLVYTQGISSNAQNSAVSATTISNSAISVLGLNIPAFRQNGTTSGSEYAGGIASRTGQSRMAGSAIFSSAQDGVSPSINTFGSVGKNTGSSYAYGISSKTSEARSSGRDIGDSAVGGMNSVSGFWEAGRDSSQGYLDGLWSKAHEIASGAASIVSNALQAAKDAIWSSSPSKKYMQLGEDSDEGYIIGVENKAGEVNETMRTLAINAMGVFYDGLSKANEAATDEDFTTPVISPVMDMTKMYGEVDYLQGLFSGAGGVLGTIRADINGNTKDIETLVVTTDKILDTLSSARAITIDGKTVIGWVDRELGARS